MEMLFYIKNTSKWTRMKVNVMSVCLRQNQPLKSNILFKKEINRYLMFYKVHM